LGLGKRTEYTEQAAEASFPLSRVVLIPSGRFRGIFDADSDQVEAFTRLQSFFGRGLYGLVDGARLRVFSDNPLKQLGKGGHQAVYCPILRICLKRYG